MVAEDMSVTNDVIAAYQRKTDELFDIVTARSHQMELDAEKPGDRKQYLIALIEERGEFEVFEDGYTYYWPNDQGGMTAHELRTIADELDRRNAPVDELFRRSV